MILLAVIIMFWLFNRFIFLPQRDKINSLEEKKIYYEEEKIRIDAILANESSIHEDYLNLNRQKDKLLLEYFPKIDQAQIIYLLNDIIDSSNLKILNLDFSEPQIEDILGIPMKTMDITLPYEGKYDELIDFLSKLRTSPRKLLVTNLIMDYNDKNDSILGQIRIKVHSLEGIFDDEGDVVAIDTVINIEKQNPFAPFEEYAEKVEDESLDNNTNNINGYSEDLNSVSEETIKGQLIEGFESGKTYFMPSSLNVKGNISRATKSKEGKYSLRFEYNILAVEEENRAYVDIKEKNIAIKYPPDSIGLWIYSYDYSPITIGLRFIDQMGEIYDAEASKGINWQGWRYIEAKPPADISVYPIKIDKLYLELSEGREDFGVILLDGLQCVYPQNETDSDNTKVNYSFYIVKQGDTLESIAIKHYGKSSKKKLIMDQNYISGNKDLKPGKILVVPR